MKSSRFYFLLTVAIGLLFVFFVVGNWVYKSYFNTEDVYTGELIVLKPIDSLREAIVTKEPSTKAGIKKETGKAEQAAGSVALRTNSAKKNKLEVAAEIIHLEAQIDALIRKQPGQVDLLLAKQQIIGLQQRIEILVDKNSEVENANNKLLEMLRKYVGDKESEEQTMKTWPAVFKNKLDEKNGEKQALTNNLPLNNFQQTNQHVVLKNDKQATSNVIESVQFSSPSFRVDHSRLLAMIETDNKDIETIEAHQTDKLVGFITLRSNQAQASAGELFIIVYQPDGRVMQKSSWESGTFQSKSGKKIYSLKQRFNNMDEENKPLSFSLSASNFVKGNYIMEIYSGAELIGKTVKKLD